MRILSTRRSASRASSRYSVNAKTQSMPSSTETQALMMRGNDW